MNIEGHLLKNYSKLTIMKIVSYVGKDASRFTELMDVFLNGPYRLTQRATVPVELCVKKENALLAPYIPELIKLLSRQDSDESLTRSILRTFQYIEIPKRSCAKVLDICMSLLTDNNTSIAIRVFSMTVAANISSIFPDIKNELAAIITDRMPYESAGFVARGKKVLKQLAIN